MLRFPRQVSSLEHGSQVVAPGQRNPPFPRVIKVTKIFRKNCFLAFLPFCAYNFQSNPFISFIPYFPL